MSSESPVDEAAEVAQPPRRRVMVDLRPLQTAPAYRRLWIGSTVSFLGAQMTAVAVAIQVYSLTGSSFAVGAIGICMLVPMIMFGLYGGAVADAVDRRRLALASSTGLALVSIVLAVQAFAGGRALWLLYVCVALQGALTAINNPTRLAMIPRLLPRELLTSANALGQLGHNLGFTLGPLLGGVVIGSLGLPAAYTLDAIGFCVALYTLYRLPAMPVGGDGRAPGLSSVLEGLRFLRTRKNVLMTFLADMCAMVLAQPRALFPAVAGGFYGGGTRTVGLLAAAPAFGAVAAALVSGWTGRVRRQGLAVLIAVTVWGVAVGLFGLSRALWIGVLCLAVAGWADMISAVFRNTILQVATPDELLGRLQGVFIVVVAGGPRLGDFTAGTVAALTSERVAILSGAVACVTALWLLAARFPGFARYDARHPQA